MQNKGVQPKDDTQRNVAYFGANSKRGFELAKWVTDANDADEALGRMQSFDVTLSPPCWPGIWNPTGCVDKMKDGAVRLDKKRQTFNPSSPEPGKWMNMLLKSPNETIDLEKDFQPITYFAAHHFMTLVRVLDAIDPRVY